VELFDPGNGGRVGPDEDELLQEAGVLEALHDGLQAGGALRVPFAGAMPQVLFIINQTGVAPHENQPPLPLPPPAGTALLNYRISGCPSKKYERGGVFSPALPF